MATIDIKEFVYQNYSKKISKMTQQPDTYRTLQHQIYILYEMKIQSQDMQNVLKDIHKMSLFVIFYTHTPNTFNFPGERIFTIISIQKHEKKF